jgi:hypothetical protein
VSATQRFTKACKKILKLTPKQIEFLLHSIRHPMVHGGIHEGYVASYPQFNNPADRITGLDPNNQLCVYACSLALKVKNGIELMDSDHAAWVYDRPGEGRNREFDNRRDAKPNETRCGYAIRRLVDEHLHSS